MILAEVHLTEVEAQEADTVFNKCCVWITLNYQNDGRVIWIQLINVMRCVITYKAIKL